MPTLRRLKSGHQQFYQALTEDERSQYLKLSKGQSPDVLVIACADSRVEPNVIMNSSPGELFTIRNVANLIPPYCPDGKIHGTSAALEFAVTSLKVGTILILGHTECGGIKACLAHDPTTETSNESFIIPWVQIAAEARYYVMRSYPNASEEEKARLLEQEAIRLSMRNLMGFPFIEQSVKMGKLKIAGAVFDVASAQLNWIE